MAYIEDNGLKLWYEITGKGEPLVLTGGFGCLHNQWDWIMDILNKDFQVINWNYRGSGQSDRYWAGGYSLDRWVDDLELILDFLNLKNVNMWGTSTGSPITIRYTAKYQERVKSMTTYPMFKADAAFRKAFLTFLDIGESFGYEALATFTSWIGVAGNHQNTDFGNKLAIHEAGLFKANFDMEALAKILETFMHFQLRSELEKIKVPTMLLLGQSGMLGSEMPSVTGLMDEFKQYCPHAETVTIPEAGGTYCMYEKPEKTAKALKEFINRASLGQTPLGRRRDFGSYALVTAANTYPHIVHGIKEKTKMSFNLAKCDYCGDCLSLCKYTDYDTDTGSEEIRRLVGNQPAEILTRCVTCAACNMYCEKGANPFDLILWHQEKTGLYKTTESYYRLAESIDKSDGEIIKGEPGRPAINICAVDVLPDLFEGQLFDGCTFLKGGAFESALGAIHIGKESPMRNTLQAKVDALANTGFDEIIMFHDDCYAAYTTKALEYNVEVPFKVKHYIEYLRDHLDEHKDKIKPLNIKIAYQQPCSSRYTPWMDKHLDELFELMTVERVERKFDRINALCCGSPISPHRSHTEGESYKQKNIQDAKESGATAMVFMCPFCALQMRDETAAAGLEPIFLTNLARMALGEKPLFQPAGLGDDREHIVAAVQIVKGLL